jgi:hypothetical protein
MIGTSWKKLLHFASAESRVNQSAGRAAWLASRYCEGDDSLPGEKMPGPGIDP